MKMPEEPGTPKASDSMPAGPVHRTIRGMVQASLVRRVVLALLVSIAIVWWVLIGMDYLAFKHEASQREQSGWVKNVLAELLDGTSEREACAVVRAIELSFNRSRQATGLEGIEDLKFRLDGSDGNTLCASQGMAGTLLMEGPEDALILSIGDRRYWASVKQASPWKLTFAEPVISDDQYLRWLIAEYLPYFMVAIPLILLPLWLVVYRGLLPLRTLAKRIATRDPADIAPLGLNLKHAELKPLEVAFDQLLFKVRQSLVRERTFVLDAAHELRTPLAVMAAQAHAVASTRGAQQLDARLALEQAVQRTSHLIHQLLTLSSIEDVQQEPLQYLDLVELTRQVLVARSAQADERGVVLSLDSPDRLSGIASAESYHRVLDNLLGNALTYCSPGGRVELTLQRQSALVQLDVRDDGPGIDPADRPHLFERFRRGRDVQVAGTGLGLAIVRGAAKAMGGSVMLGHGLDGRGIGFVVTFDFPEQRNEGRGTQ